MTVLCAACMAVCVAVVVLCEVVIWACVIKMFIDHHHIWHSWPWQGGG